MALALLCFFLYSLFDSKTLFFPKFNLALIPLKFTYPPCLKYTLINIKVVSMIAVLLFLTRCLQSYVVFIHVIIYYVMFLTNKRILNLIG